jgi:transposase
LTTKIHIAVDGKGRPVRFILTPGQANDCTQALALLDGMHPRYVLADRAYDTHDILDAVEARGAQPIIPQRSNMKRPRAFDADIYRKRNLVERAINKLKHFRRIATRYDRKPDNFKAFLFLAVLPAWIPMNVDSP